MGRKNFRGEFQRLDRWWELKRMAKLWPEWLARRRCRKERAGGRIAAKGRTAAENESTFRREKDWRRRCSLPPAQAGRRTWMRACGCGGWPTRRAVAVRLADSGSTCWWRKGRWKRQWIGSRSRGTWRRWGLSWKKRAENRRRLTVSGPFTRDDS